MDHLQLPPLPEGKVPDPVFWDRLITTPEAARFLSLSTRHVEGLRLSGGGPKFVQVGKRGVRYRHRDLQTWIEGRLRRSTSDTAGDVQ